MTDLVVTKDGATICGVLVPRPRRISISQWFEYWERVRRLEENFAYPGSRVS